MSFYIIDSSFDVSKAKDYYQLSGKNPDDLMVGVRDTVDSDSAKKNQADFVLWFTDSKFKNQDMRWDSPWGIGYPGWHIECSGISYKRRVHIDEMLDFSGGLRHTALSTDREFPEAAPESGREVHS